MKIMINIDDISSSNLKLDGSIANLCSCIIYDKLRGLKPISELESKYIKSIALLEGTEITNCEDNVDLIIRHDTENKNLAGSNPEFLKLACERYIKLGKLGIDLNLIIRESKNPEAVNKAEDIVMRLDRILTAHHNIYASQIYQLSICVDVYESVPKGGEDIEILAINTAKRRAHMLLKYLRIILEEIDKNDNVLDNIRKRCSEQIIFDNADGVEEISI